MDYFDYRPQKFYLLSREKRRLFSFVSEDRSVENAVENAFAKLPRIEGGNIYALYRFSPLVLEVMAELSEKLKVHVCNIQQLPSYFKGFRDNDVFIRHNASVDIIDIRRSLIKIKAIENNRNENADDNCFVLTWGILYQKYETYSYGLLTEKIYIGEKDPEARICRFCENTGKNYFKNESHAIMESLGNKLLLCNEECDECNTLFEEKGVENNLYRFLEINRTLSRIPGKKTRNHSLEGLNFCIRPDKDLSMPVVFIKQDKIINDVYNGAPTGRVLLFNKGEVSYYGIFKALVKIAVDMIPSCKFSHFVNTGKWVHGDMSDMEFPPFLYGEHNEFFEQPVLDLFFKTNNSPSFSPFCTAILYIYDAIFIYAIPFCNVDENIYTSKESILNHWNYFKKRQYLYVGEWAEIDSNDKTLKSPFYKLPLFSDTQKYKIEFKPSDDDVFKRPKNKE